MGIYYIVWLLIIVPYLLMPNRHSFKFEKKYAVYIAVCLILLMGLRGVSVGADTIQYERRYRTVEDLIKPGAPERGYSFFSYVFSCLGFSFYGYNFVVACVLSGTLMLFYACYSKNTAFSAIIFMTIGLLPMYMSGTRQSLAISICLVAYILVDKHHSLFAIALVLLASTFHTSAIACMVAVALIAMRIRLSKQTLFIILGVAAATIVLRNGLVSIIVPLIPEKYAAIDLDANYHINPLLIVISLLIPAFCLLFDVDVSADGKFDCTKTWMYIFACLNAVFIILSPSSVYFSRVAYYFVHVNSIIVPNMILGQTKYENRQLMNILIIAVCMAFFVISMPEGTLVIDKYRFFWQEPL